jgi:hypothetical protein
MILEDWLNGNLKTLTEEDASKALDELESVGDEIQSLTGQGKHWEAYEKLNGSIALANMASEQHPTKQPRIVQKLLAWIRKLKGAIDKMVQGIGGVGYSVSIAASIPPKLSITVSFSVKPS